MDFLKMLRASFEYDLEQLKGIEELPYKTLALFNRAFRVMIFMSPPFIDVELQDIAV